MTTAQSRPNFFMALILLCAAINSAWLAAEFPVYPLSEPGAMLLLGTVMICISIGGRKMHLPQSSRHRAGSLDVLPDEA
jgi:hypothetical protein